MSDDSPRPLLALAIGDPAGISPELTARLVADPELALRARLLVVGDARILAMGAAQAGVAIDLPDWHEDDERPAGHALLDLHHCAPADVELGKATLAGGRFAMRNFTTALQLARQGRVDAVTFTPFNKQAMRLARPGYDDEIAVVSEVLGGVPHGREFNILDDLWNARVTSHIPLAEVASHLSVAAIHEAAVLADRCLRAAGFEAPRLAVAGLNPHAGDGGSFGREEIDVIAPAIARMQAQGIAAVGPLPADTVFVRARKGEFDAVLTMFHDQGQIAMKLMGFDRGVTFLGGYDFPICTPAHGTAYDIVGQRRANLQASRNALTLAAVMATRLELARAH